MLDNGSVKIGGDDIEKRIVERLGARQEKLERMAAWENSSRVECVGCIQRCCRLRHALRLSLCRQICCGVAVLLLRIWEF